MPVIIAETDRNWQNIKNTFLDFRVGRTGRAAILLRMPDLMHQIGEISVEEVPDMRAITAELLADAKIVPGPTGIGELFIINRAMTDLLHAFNRPYEGPFIHAAFHLSLVSLYRECGDLPGRQEDELCEALKEFYT